MITPPERLHAALAGVSAAHVVLGHTHSQFDLRHGAVRVINAGSVGMPYEARPAAYWALLGPGVRTAAHGLRPAPRRRADPRHRLAAGRRLRRRERTGLPHGHGSRHRAGAAAQRLSAAAAAATSASTSAGVVCHAHMSRTTPVASSHT